MKLCALLLTVFSLLASTSHAGVIHDVRTGVYAKGDTLPDIHQAVVVFEWEFEGISGMYVYSLSESPSGEFRAAQWLAHPEESDSIHPLAPGTVISLSGALADSTTLGYSLWTWPRDEEVTITGTTEIPWVHLEASDLAGVPPENPWYMCPLHIADGFVIEYRGSGTYARSTRGGDVLVFDFQQTSVRPRPEDCFLGAYCVYWWNQTRLTIVPGGVELVDCSVPASTVKFGTLKASYGIH
jgi:hypothetical protein